ncbi:MAG: 4-(cytidine 5'-diphospho)-2-C-methyl-D-erythritol kinase [Aquabacterium sp.]
MPTAVVQALWDLPAPAKVNRFLHVVGRRPDGYHLLQSVFQLIDWCDRLHIERRIDGQLRRHDIGPPLPPDDLILRAARALQAASGCTLGADIQVDKQVPWGAGLGGGSSDAATTLLALNRLWGLHWRRERLMALALPLGADIPFFLGGRHAFVQGIGEQLTPLELPVEWLAVVKPPQGIATAAIFGSPMLRRDAPPHIIADFLVSTSPGGMVDGFGRNDLQPAAEDHCPAVAQVGRWLEARFGNSRMSGSGSAVFARAGTGSQPSATWAADELPLHWVGRMCRSLDSHPLGAWAD